MAEIPENKKIPLSLTTFPKGGLSGYKLIKKSDDDYDIDWGLDENINLIKAGNNIHIDNENLKEGDVTISLSENYQNASGFVKKGVRTQLNNWNRNLDINNKFSLWQDPFEWTQDLYSVRRVIEFETTGLFSSTDSVSKKISIGLGFSTTSNYNSSTFGTVQSSDIVGVVDYDLHIKGTLTISSTGEIKSFLKLDIFDELGILISSHIKNDLIAINLSNQNINIALTGILNAGTGHSWNQKHTFLKLW